MAFPVSRGVTHLFSTNVSHYLYRTLGLRSRFSNRLSTKVIFIAADKAYFELAEWTRLPPLGKHIGVTGNATAGFWGWTLTCHIPQPPTVSGQEHLQALQHESEVASMVKDAKSSLTQHVALSRPLVRPSRWTQGSTPPRKTTAQNSCSRSD